VTHRTLPASRQGDAESAEEGKDQNAKTEEGFFALSLHGEADRLDKDGVA
jgi:hypothetical protein